MPMLDFAAMPEAEKGAASASIACGTLNNVLGHFSLTWRFSIRGMFGSLRK